MSNDSHLKTYLVGGALRDKILARPASDRDWVVVGATPETMLELGYRQVGKHFPVFLHPQTHEEYALARTERKVAAGHQGFEFNASPDVTLEEDLMRRDLTINAIAEDTDGTLIDPYGGIKDLEARVLRHVSDAFAEDPLRVLRVARFSAQLAPFEFTICDETIALMTQITQSGELQALSTERVWTEFQRALSFSNPQPFFDALKACGALAELFPELDQLYGIPQVAEYHPEIDCGIHNEMVLQQICLISNDPIAKFAALCHDFGKATTPGELLPKHHGHEERGADIAEEFSKRLRVPNDYRQLAVLTARYHSHCHRALELKATSVLKLIANLDAFRKPERFETFLQVCEADARGRKGLEDRLYPQADFLRGALASLQAVDTGAIAKRVTDSEGKSDRISIEIRSARIAAIKQYMRNAKA